MKRLTITGIMILILGTIIYLILINEISGISRAIIIGLIIGAVMILGSQFK